MAEAPQTRATLLIRLRDPHDGSAWAEFVEVYCPLIHGYALKRGLQDADAADLTQEVLQAVAAALPRLEYDPARGSFRGWLFTVVRNRLLNLVRRQTGQPRGEGGTENLELLHRQPAAADDDEELWRREYRQQLFNWAADRVRPAVEESSWRAFWLTAVEGLPAREAAGRLGLSVAAVYMARSRVLARIKECIRQVQEDFPDD